MRVLAGQIVDWTALGKVVIYSLSIGVGVTIAFSLSIVGITRFTDMRRDGRHGAASIFGVVAAFGLALCVAAIVFGIVELTTKK